MVRSAPSPVWRIESDGGAPPFAEEQHQPPPTGPRATAPVVAWRQRPVAIGRRQEQPCQRDWRSSSQGTSAVSGGHARDTGLARSREIIEVVRLAYDAFNRGDLEDMSADAAPEFEYAATA